LVIFSIFESSTKSHYFYLLSHAVNPLKLRKRNGRRYQKSAEKNMPKVPFDSHFKLSVFMKNYRLNGCCFEFLMIQVLHKF